MTAELQRLLEAGARELDVPLDAVQLERLLGLLAEVSEWNTRFNLTAIRDPGDMLRKHLLDSLAVHSHLQGALIADVGSGAGFPGLPLAVAKPAMQFTLIESTAKKAHFIEQAAAKLALANVCVVNARAENWRPPQRFDRVISRALAKLPDFIRVTEHLCLPEGRLLAMKGRYPQDEIAALPQHVRAKHWRVAAVHRLHVPGLDAERHLIELSRIR